jgi:hypothetical protein
MKKTEISGAQQPQVQVQVRPAWRRPNTCPNHHTLPGIITHTSHTSHITPISEPSIVGVGGVTSSRTVAVVHDP